MSTNNNREYVIYIGNTSQTVRILDEFESKHYERIVIKNGFMVFTSCFERMISYNFVIERLGNQKAVGDITFTQFKQEKGGFHDLIMHAHHELTNDILVKYVNTDKFYRFTTPFLLRAQNSSNLTGYGWEWDWTDGVGSYIKGTEYGETTQYAFVGAYITLGAHYYRPEERIPFDSQQIKE